MRDLLNDLTEGLSHPDPVIRAQKQMQKPLPKRFYKDVSVSEESGVFTILLDGKNVRTPARNPLSVPSATLAEDLRAEWDAQTEVIDPLTMPLTRMVNTAIDGIAADSRPVFDDIVRFAGNDMLCYRADTPEELVTRQKVRWNPVLAWVANEAGAHFTTTEGVMHQEQPASAIAAFSKHLERHSTALELAALHTVTTLTGSAILALAFAEGHVSLDEAWSLAHLEEDWTAEQWGEDEEATLRREKRFVEMQTAARILETLKTVP